MATVDARGYVYITVAHGLFAVHDVLGLHIGVGFCVARSDYIGQCEGLRVSGRATGTDSRAFSVCKQSILFTNPPASGARRRKTHNAMKTIIAIKAPGNRGKTHSVMAAARSFPMSDVEHFQYYPDGFTFGPNPSWVLCRGKCSYAGKDKVVGFSSEGDSLELVENGLKALTGNGMFPDVIVLACRSKGDSVFAIRKFATEHGYNVIWTSNYCGRTYGCNGFEGEACAQFPNGTDLNGIFAENIVSLISKLLS